MADFNVELSAPQGAGANAVAPVQEQAVNTAPMQIIGELGSIFAKGVGEHRKDQAEAAKNSVLKQYSQRLGTLHDASQQGVRASEIHTRTQALHRELAANHPELITDIEKIASFYSNRSQVGEAEKEIVAGQKRREELITSAQKQGYRFIPGMDKEAEDSMLEAHSTTLKAQAEFDRMVQKHNYEVSRGNHDYAVQERELADLSHKQVIMIASAHIDSTQAQVRTLHEKMKRGELTKGDAAITLNEIFTGIYSQLDAAAGKNSQLAAPWRKTFQDMQTLAVQMTDPKTLNESFEEKIKLLKNQAKLYALGDPKVLAAAVTQEILPNNAGVAIAVAPEGIRAFSMIATRPTDGKSFDIPQIVGNPEAESGVVKILKEGIKGLQTGKYGDKDKAVGELSNSVNHLLKQTSDMLDKGADAKDLKGITEFFASPEYAHLVSTNKINPQAATAAQKALQIGYNQVVTGQVMTKFDSPLRTVNAREGEKQIPLGEAVEIKFSGTGINFLPKTLKGANDGMLAQQMSAVRQLESSSVAINKLIRIGAHMEGTTNYAAYWEKNKHVLFPGYFMEGVEPGMVKNGFKFKGGDARVAANWERQATDGSKSK